MTNASRILLATIKRIGARRGKSSAPAALLFSLVMIMVSANADADEVYGTVTLNNKPAAGETLELRRNGSPGVIEVQTDSNGRYRVFLEAGRYKVVLKGRNAGPQTVRSLPAAVRRDLDFQHGR